LCRLYSIVGARAVEMLAGLCEGTVLELLARRYARGGIDRQEYRQKRSDILGYRGMPPRS
jgi:uncharacterized membrane protein